MAAVEGGNRLIGSFRMRKDEITRASTFHRLDNTSL